MKNIKDTIYKYIWVELDCAIYNKIHMNVHSAIKNNKDYQIMNNIFGTLSDNITRTPINQNAINISISLD